MKAVLGTALALASVRSCCHRPASFAFAALHYPLLLGLRLIALWRAVGTWLAMAQVRTAALAVGRGLGCRWPSPLL
ncbi:hypothetical protein [Xylella fastidiosa]|uniref:hypothetical protein n=1 Tax=Xylella fastidiosa TaxID=2371 RepID=UPI0035D4F0F6